MFRKIGLIILLLFIFSACSRSGFPSTQGKLEVSPTDTVSPEMTADEVDPDAEFLQDEKPPFNAESEFSTDFSRHSVPYSGILSGGPPKDGIPAIDAPTYVSVADADSWLVDHEPVIVFKVGDVARAYPIQILTWHEIVNDELNGVPVVVSFCPLCNTAIAFDRRVEDRVLDFGTTGRLRYSNMIMYDRQTETWWQQATGEGIVGEFTGQKLTFMPANIVSWRDFKETYPAADVLSRNTGYIRSYGENPYPGYDNVANSPYLYDGPETPDTLLAMARVLTVALNDDAVAYPYDLLRQLQVVEDVVGGEPVVVLWQPGTSSALDRFEIAEGQDVGAIAAFSRSLDGQELSFEVRDGLIVDTQTGSTWDVLGRASTGPLQGKQLDAVVSVNHFWFSWAAFKPETRVFTGESVGEEAHGRADEEVKPTPSISKLPLDFEIILYKGQKILGGETVSVSDILAEGKPMVVVFWAGLCPICRVEMPDIQAAYLEFGDQVNFIGVDVGLYANLGSRDDAENLIEELGLEFPSGTTMDFRVMPTYKITAIPTTLFMKPDGWVLHQENTLMGKDLLYDRIEALIASSES